MRSAVLWGLLAVLCHYTLVSSHVLGRASSTSDLAQLKSLLERFEETLADAVQQEDSEADYEGTNQESERAQANQGWGLDQEGDQDPLKSDRIPPAAEGRSRPLSQRNRLQDLLLTRRRASSCFGARMDRIGNASGLGCNTGRG
ncbi:natriuretic peptides A [Solea solea]|uniref:natriuretic peptides A n=1 Tax=Solea solea TaxID=90069 RepID=UPI00272D65A1|nr:natriuretic peptides A [Solea solea]